MAKRRWYARTYIWAIVLVPAAIAALGAYEFFTVKADRTSYILGAVERGDIVIQVACTGTLAAVTTVQVGTQVSGTVAELDVDFNSKVQKGQLLAKLDPELFKAQVQQAEASVRTAQASLNDDQASIASAKANLVKAEVDVANLQRKLKIQKELWGEGLIPKDDLDTAQANLDASAAAQKAQQAQIDSADARLKADQQRLSQAQASLDQARVNLEHTIITSPIAGTIISRSVDRGQTVAASFSSPTLFTIGEDLTKMQVSTNIDEADVGKIKANMPATFTVDAYPGEVFQGVISQVRLAATTVQNVVTYNAMIDVANPQEKLKPGMTANVKILIDRAENALKIPNSALRFRPNMTDVEMEAAFRRAGAEAYYLQSKSRIAGRDSQSPGTSRGGASQGAGMQRGNLSGNGVAAATRPQPGHGGRQVALWVPSGNNSLQPVLVRLGLTDGIQTQIVSGSLAAGDKIVTGTDNGQGKAAAGPARAPGFGGPGPGGMRGIR